MRAQSLIARLVLTAFILVALFGVYGMVSFSHADNGGCPIMPNQHSMCTTPLEHLGHWQSVFTAVFAEVFVLMIVAVLFVSIALVTDPLRGIYWKLHERAPVRLPLFQELFSAGILNRKEPYHS